MATTEPSLKLKMSYHISVKTISRARGQSVVRKAAYNARALLSDERTGARYNYTRKQDLVHRAIVAPADAPKWAWDSEQLWNRAEQAEKRKDSCVGREIEFAIPHELSAPQRLNLALSIAQAVSQHYSLVAELCIHEDSKVDWSGSPKNFQGWHAHLLLTTRSVDASGFKNKTRALDDKKSGAVAYWREKWAEMANAQLVLAGFPARLDHRSLSAQGILDRRPTKHLGPQVVARERRGYRTSMGDAHRALLAAFVDGCSTRGIVAPLVDTVTTVAQALSQRAKRQEVADQLQQRARQLLAISDVRTTVEKLAAELSRNDSGAHSYQSEAPR
jgi:hypothetical protein